MRHGVVLIVVLAAVLALGVGCAPEGAIEVTPTETPGSTTPSGSPGSSPEQEPTVAPTETPADTPGGTPTAPPAAEPDVPEDAAAAVAWARRDLASRLNASEDAVTLVSIEAVEWRDSSLGCPQPGQMYLQVITPGYRFALGAEGATYEYHSARGAEQAILCESAG